MTSIAKKTMLAAAVAAATLMYSIGNVNAQATPAKQYAETAYPVILVPGVGGAESYSKGTIAMLGGLINSVLKALNIQFAVPTTDVDYWYGFKQELERSGAKVYVADLEAFSVDDAKDPLFGVVNIGRGDQLLNYANAVMAQTGATKVNFIGHNQGGMTARYVAAVAPGKVASVTTIGTPHKGSELIDQALNFMDQQKLTDSALTALTVASIAQRTADGKANLQYTPFQNAQAALRQLTVGGAKQFNAKFPSAGLSTASCASGAATANVDGNTQRMYSYTGAAFQPYSLFGVKLVSDTSLSWFLDSAQWTDPSTLALRAAGVFVANQGVGANDGLVSVCSAKYGQDVGTYQWNHLDEINQFLGIRGGKAENPVAVMKTHLNRLQKDGV
ncbi:esterase/lipase family protein [Collimonas sp.]|jgi:triacylglycerol lipase|uniref:esterase/lipase family protein n=1 Tax=Collimonas sp. TaxID=1963772 RepID=UPI002B6F9FF4|nr:alpha/beta fold hydrolase [Collimonas sp.]HWW08070.1 alpha/beta fold hydrolase [Collimonas sp.]